MTLLKNCWDWSDMPKRQPRSTVVNASGDTFGDDVRRVRIARGMSQTGLTMATGYSRTYVSKVETGTVIPTLRFAEGCDKAFNTGDLFVRQLRRITEGEHPAWFAPYIDAEREASAIRDFSTMFVMGLLQTPEYARASLSGARPRPPQDIDAKVTSRLRRHEVLEAVTPPTVWVVLCEPALWNIVGSSRTMADQMSHILAMMRRHPTLTVQVLPFSSADVAISAAYVVLDIPGSGPQVYVEGPQGGRPYQATDSVNNAVRIYDLVRAGSLSARDSAAYIDSVRSEHERNAMDQVQPQRPPRGQLRRVGPGARVRRQHPRPRQ